MGGILEGVTSGQPGKSRIKAVAAGGEYARHFCTEPFLAAARRSERLGYKLIIRLDRYSWTGGKWPYEDWPKWEEYVGRQADVWDSGLFMTCGMSRRFRNIGAVHRNNILKPSGGLEGAGEKARAGCPCDGAEQPYL